MIEIEAKIKVPDFAVLQKRLQAMNASRMGQYEEINTFFDTRAKSLLAADQGLRLRRKRDTGSGSDEFILTFKGPRIAGPLKQREEWELVVASDANAIALLQALGYEQIFQFEKRREVWRMDDCEIALDEIPKLGKFIEVEGPGEAAIHKILHDLGMAGEPLIRESYVALLMK